MKKEELKAELANMRSLLNELEKTLKSVGEDEERLLKELDCGESALEESAKLRERIERLLQER